MACGVVINFGSGLSFSFSGKASNRGPQEKPMKDEEGRSRSMDLFDLWEGVGCRRENWGEEVEDWNSAEKAKAAELGSSCSSDGSVGAVRGVE